MDSYFLNAGTLQLFCFIKDLCSVLLLVALRWSLCVWFCCCGCLVGHKGAAAFRVLIYDLSEQVDEHRVSIVLDPEGFPLVLFVLSSQACK